MILIGFTYLYENMGRWEAQNYRVFRKNWVFAQFTATPPSPTSPSNFLYNQYQPSAGEGEEANFREFLEKHNI